MEDFVRDGSLPKYGLDKLEQEEFRGALQEIAQDDELRGALQEIADRDGIKPEEKKTLGQTLTSNHKMSLRQRFGRYYRRSVG